MYLFIGTDYKGGRQFPVVVSEDATLSDLKKTIAKKECLPYQSIYLTIDGTPVPSGVPLKSKGIKEYMVLHLFLIEELRQRDQAKLRIAHGQSRDIREERSREADQQVQRQTSHDSASDGGERRRVSLESNKGSSTKWWRASPKSLVPITSQTTQSLSSMVHHPSAKHSNPRKRKHIDAVILPPSPPPTLSPPISNISQTSTTESKPSRKNQPDPLFTTEPLIHPFRERVRSGVVRTGNKTEMYGCRIRQLSRSRSRACSEAVSG